MLVTLPVWVRSCLRVKSLDAGKVLTQMLHEKVQSLVWVRSLLVTLVDCDKVLMQWAVAVDLVNVRGRF